MATPVLALKDCHLTFGGTPLLAGAELQVLAQDRICLVGRNGSGKSTLLKIAAGLVAADTAERFVQPGLRIAYLPQEPDLDGFKTVGAYAASGLSDPSESYRAEAMLDALQIDQGLHPQGISGGEARRAALAMTLAPGPDVLLLDEPTNHLDLPAIRWLESELASMRAALVLISHDRRFLERLSKTTVWLDRGRTRRMDKGFAHFEAWRDDIFEKEAEAAHKLDRKIAREENWMQGGVTARRKRNVRRVADLHDLRQKRRESQGPAGSVNMEASAADASGRLVFEAKSVSKAFNGEDPVVKDVGLRVMRGDRLGLVGPNGAGKTTLLKMLIGQLEPDTGSVRRGANLNVVWLDQKREALSDDETLTDVLTGGRGETVFVNGRSRHVASYLKDFLFQPEQFRSPVKVLSGGERARLLLARALSQPSNVLVLDEPTNDLDLETLDLLQDLLGDYAGTLLLVSHDRDFLDRVCTSVLAAEGDGGWTEYAGGYSDMLAQRGEDLPGRRAERPGQNVTSAKSAGRTADPPRPPRRSRKLSFKDKHALETLPATIADLEAQATALQAELAAPDLYTKAPETFRSKTQQLANVQDSLAAAEEQWLELEMKREDLEGS